MLIFTFHIALRLLM